MPFFCEEVLRSVWATEMVEDPTASIVVAYTQCFVNGMT
jgi:hypothetical protein